MEKLKDKFALEIEERKVKKRLHKTRAEVQRDAARKQSKPSPSSFERKTKVIKLPKARIQLPSATLAYAA